LIIIAPGGYYTLPETGPNATRLDAAVCPAGFYCTGGVRRACPPGRYGAESGLQSSACSGLCKEGCVGARREVPL
jgi:hypothetical protein